MTVSVLMALYNEEEFVGAILARVLQAPLLEGMNREVIVVDDGSTDGSALVAEEFASRYPGTVRLIRHDRNRGKGAAIRTASSRSFRTPTSNTTRGSFPNCCGPSLRATPTRSTVPGS